MRFTFITAAVWILLLLLASCSSSLYQPAQSNIDALAQQGITTNIPSLAEGRALYVESCGGCHYLHLPSSLTVAEWKAVYPEMSLRTSRTPAELEKIQAYLLAGAKPELAK